MSEPFEGARHPEAPPESAGTLTAGAMLRQAREAQGLDLVSLSTLLKVTPRKLEALEADRHDELQGATFVRALAQAACRVLKLDPAPVLARLPRQEARTLEQVSSGLNTPFRDRGGKREPAAEQLLASKPFLGVIGLIVVGALALWLLPRDGAGWRWLTQAAPDGAAGAASAVVETVPQAGETPGVVTESVAVSPAPIDAASAAPPLAVTSEATVPAPAVAAPAVMAAASVPVVPAPAAAPGVDPSAPVQLRARQDSWIEVIDGSGRTLLARTVRADEALGLAGAFPMRVKIGNVAGTDLSLRGQPVDLAALTRDNVARLELK